MNNDNIISTDNLILDKDIPCVMDNKQVIENEDIDFMYLALKEAEKAYKKGEVPIGAIIVKDDKVIAKAYNLRQTTKNAVAHAEVLAIKKACKKLKTWHLVGCTLYVTLEPCPMCSGAIINSRIDRVVFGAFDNKAGCCGTLYNLPLDARFNHRPRQVVGGVLDKECGQMLTQFFKLIRNKK